MNIVVLVKQTPDTETKPKIDLGKGQKVVLAHADKPGEELPDLEDHHRVGNGRRERGREFRPFIEARGGPHPERPDRSSGKTSPSMTGMSDMPKVGIR